MSENLETIDLPEMSALAEPEESLALPIAIDIKYILHVVKRRIVFVVIAAVLAGAGAFVLRSKTVVKQWAAKCVVIKHDKHLSGSKDVPYLYQDTNFKTLVETVKLRENLQRVIDELNLGSITTGELANAVEVTEGGKNSNVLNVETTWTEPVMASKITNRMVEIFIESHNRILNSAADKVYRYYVTQKEVQTKRLSVAQDDFLRFKEAHGVVSVDSEMMLKLEKISVLELKLEEAIMLEKEYATQLESMRETVDSLPDTVKLSETFRSGQDELAREMQIQLDTLRQKYTDDNPKVKALIAQLDSVKKNMGSKDEKSSGEETYGTNTFKESLKVELVEIENFYSSSKEKVIGYTTAMEKYSAEVSELGSIEKEYFDLERKVDQASDLLVTINDKIVQAKMAKEVNVSDLEILEYASIPDEHLPTRKKLMAIGAFMGTGFIGTLILLGAAVLNGKVKTKADIKGWGKVDMFGTLPDRSLVTETEYFVRLQMAVKKIDDALPNQRPCVVNVSSFENGEGRTTLMNEYAYLKTHVGKKVLVIEQTRAVDTIINQSVVNSHLFEHNYTGYPKLIRVCDNLDKLYLHIDESICRLNLSLEMVERFYARWMNYDYVLIEMFQPDMNIQVASQLIGAADLNLLITKFQDTPKGKMKKIAADIAAVSKNRAGMIINFTTPAFTE